MKSGAKWTNICSRKRSDEVEELLTALNLGKLLEEPRPLSGGFMHRMDQAICESGMYAVKTLNPQIMKRPEAYRNMVLSEKIAVKMKNVVPAIAAMEFQGKQVLSVGDGHYMVFPWQDGSSMYPPDITEYHCEKMGDVLGRMHRASVQVEELKKECPVVVDLGWNAFLSGKKNESCSFALREAMPQLEVWLSNANKAAKRLSMHQVISHRDLDPKNVLWQGTEPFLIDWEAAGYINPFQELTENLYYWADDGNGGLLKSHFYAFLNAYERHVSLKDAPWPDVFHACFMAPLEWLHYNLRRASGMEGESERQLGKEQMVITLQTLNQLEEKNRLAGMWLQKRA